MGVDRLFLEHRTGANPSVWQYINSTPTKLGNSFGTTNAPSVNPERHSSRNRVVHYLGEVYAVLYDGVYRYNQGPGNFTSGTVPGDWSADPTDGALTFTSVLANQDQRMLVSGLYPVVISDVPHLICIRSHLDGLDRLEATHFNSSTGIWSEGGAVVVTPTLNGGAAGGIHNAIVYRNILHFSVGSDAAGNPRVMMTYDPSTGAFASIAEPGATPTPEVDGQYMGDFCVFQDRLFKTTRVSTPDSWYVQEYTGGAWALLIDTGLDVSSGMDHSATRQAMFTDGTNMYIATLQTGTLWNIYQISAGLSPSNITGATTPPAGAGTTARCEAFVDIDSDPLVPTFELHFTADAIAATVRGSYSWNGPATPVGNAGAAQDTGGDVAHGAPTDDRQGGERYFTTGQLDILIIDRTATFGGEQISFKVFGDAAGAATKKMKLYFTVDGEATLVEAQLIAPISGGSATFNSGSNQVEGLLADGTTVYTIVWDLDGQTPAVASGDRVTRHAEVFV